MTGTDRQTDGHTTEKTRNGSDLISFVLFEMDDWTDRQTDGYTTGKNTKWIRSDQFRVI